MADSLSFSSEPDDVAEATIPNSSFASTQLIHKSADTHKPDIKPIAESATRPAINSVTSTAIDKTTGLLFDPVLMGVKVTFPLKYQAIFKDVSEIPFLYDFTENSIIEIKELTSGKTLGRIETGDFETFSFSEIEEHQSIDINNSSVVNDLAENRIIGDDTKDRNTVYNETSTNVIYKNTIHKDSNNNNLINKANLEASEIPQIFFIFNKEVFKSKNKLETSKKYKESLKTKVPFVDEEKYKKIKENFLIFQVKKLVNFVFIEGPEHLHSQIKAFLQNKEVYIPKTAKFIERKSFVKNLIQQIPGISDCVGQAIVNAFPSLGSLEQGLLDKTSFCRIRILDEGSERSISSKIYEKLFKVFYSENPTERI